jgi:hypothetical protein
MSDDPLLSQTEIEHDDFRALCEAVGFVILNWSIAEQQLDNWVNVAFINCGGKALRRDGDIPRSFKQKTEFFTRCLKNLPTLNSFREEGAPLVSRLRDASNLRNSIVHGSIVSMGNTDGIYRFRKVGYEKEIHTVEYFTFGPSDFFTLEKELGNLIAEQMAFSQKLADTFLASPG